MTDQQRERIVRVGLFCFLGLVALRAGVFFATGV
jgi:hypothetical protein